MPSLKLHYHRFTLLVKLMINPEKTMGEIVAATVWLLIFMLIIHVVGYSTI